MTHTTRGIWIYRVVVGTAVPQKTLNSRNDQRSIFYHGMGKQKFETGFSISDKFVLASGIIHLSSIIVSFSTDLQYYLNKQH